MFAFAFQTGGGAALSWQQVLRDIPHDLGAIFVYLLLGFFIFLVVYGSRPEVIERFGSPMAPVERDVEGSRGGPSRDGSRQGSRVAGR